MHRGNPKPPLAHFVAYALHRTRLFIAAFIIASKVICDDTYSNHSWCIVAQKMFDLKEINQMEREICAYLQWDLKVKGGELFDFSAGVRFELGAQATVAASLRSLAPILASVNACTRRGGIRDQSQRSRPLVSSYNSQPQRVVHSQMAFAAPPDSPSNSPLTAAHSSQPDHFTSASSSLMTSPASCCQTPPSATVTPAGCRLTKKTDVCHAFDIKHDITRPNWIPPLSLSAGVGEEVSENIHVEGDFIRFMVPL
jgi:hypothetical protein